VSGRRILAAAGLVALVVAGIDWQYLALPFVDRSGLAELARREADRQGYPHYPRFLEAVRARTRSGQSIAIVAPPMRWSSGYDYAYYRASYFLAGRTVLPVIDRHDRAHAENLQAADFIAVWEQPFPLAGHRVAWRGEGGILLVRE